MSFTIHPISSGIFYYCTISVLCFISFLLLVINEILILTLDALFLRLYFRHHYAWSLFWSIPDTTWAVSLMSCWPKSRTANSRFVTLDIAVSVYFWVFCFALYSGAFFRSCFLFIISYDNMNLLVLKLAMYTYFACMHSVHRTRHITDGWGRLLARLSASPRPHAAPATNNVCCSYWCSAVIGRVRQQIML